MILQQMFMRGNRIRRCHKETPGAMCLSRRFLMVFGLIIQQAKDSNVVLAGLCYFFSPLIVIIDGEVFLCAGKENE